MSNRPTVVYYDVGFVGAVIQLGIRWFSRGVVEYDGDGWRRESF